MISPLVSIIMPCFNVEKFVDYALSGLKHQLYKHFQLIAIDDGSTDNTYKHLSRAEGDFDIKIVTSTPNRGLPAALNLGLAHADGEFIARFDPDDFMHEWRLRDQVFFLLGNPDVDLVGGGASTFGINEWEITPKASHKQIIDEYLLSNPFVHPTVMFRRRLLDLGLLSYREDLATDEDYELWSRLLPKVTTANLVYSVIKYRIHSSNGQRNPGKRAAKEIAIRQFLTTYGIENQGITTALAEYQCSNFLSYDGYLCLKEYAKSTPNGPRLGWLHDKLIKRSCYEDFMADMW